MVESNAVMRPPWRQIKHIPSHLGSILVRVENRQEFLDLDDPALPNSAYTLSRLFTNVSDLVLVIKTHRNRQSGVRPHPPLQAWLTITSSIRYLGKKRNSSGIACTSGTHNFTACTRSVH